MQSLNQSRFTAYVPVAAGMAMLAAGTAFAAAENSAGKTTVANGKTNVAKSTFGQMPDGTEVFLFTLKQWRRPGSQGDDLRSHAGVGEDSRPAR